MAMTARQVWNLFSEADDDLDTAGPERAELLEQLVKLGASREVMTLAPTSVLAETLRVCQEGSGTREEVMDEAPCSPDGIRAKPITGLPPFADRPRFEMNVGTSGFTNHDDEMTRRDEQMSCRFDEGADNLRRSMDYGPQHTGMANYGGFDPRKTSRESWSRWQNESEKSLDELLRSHGAKEEQLQSLSKMEKGQMAEKLISMSDAELKDFVRKTGTRGVPSPASPAGMREPVESGGADPIQLLKKMQAGNSVSTRKFSERRNRPQPMNRIGALNKFWERHGAELEKHGDTYASYEALAKNPNVTDGELTRILQ